MSNLYLYKLFTWRVPKWHSALALISVHIFFYFYIMCGISLVSFASLSFILMAVVRLFLAPDKNCEILSDDSIRALYVALYTGLNKFVQYLRSIIQLKGNLKAVGKAAFFMYLSLVIKFLGDKVTLYLGKEIVILILLVVLALFIVPTLILSKQKKGEEDDSEAEKNAIIQKILAWIPKYSDL